MKNRTLAVSLKLGAAALSFAGLLGWSGQANHFSSQALAAVTPAQASTIQADVQRALANVNPSLTGTARDAAIQQALATVTRSEVAAYGPDAINAVANSAAALGVSSANLVQGILIAAIATVPAATVIADIEVGGVNGGGSATTLTEAIIAVAQTNGIAPATVGTGLGQAALQLPQASANQIAAVIANEGLPGTATAFAAVVTGQNQQLAALALASPGGTGATTGGGGGLGDVGGVGGAGGGASSFSGQSFTQGTPTNS